MVVTRFSRTCSSPVSRASRAFGVSLLTLVLAATTAFAQNGRPAPAPQPSSSGNPNSGAPVAPPPAPPVNNGLEPAPEEEGEGERSTVIRRSFAGDKEVFAFRDVSVQDTIGFIMETTGKVVMPVNANMLTSKVTVIMDEPVDRNTALDLLFRAFNFAGIGIAEYPDSIVLAPLSDVGKLSPPPVLRTTDDVSRRQDLGTIVIKIFAVQNGQADKIAELIQENVPDWAVLLPDVNSNQLILRGSINLARHVQEMINELDKPSVFLKIQNFKLKHADAQAIMTNILDLFEGDRSGATQRRVGAADPAAAERQARIDQARQAAQRVAGGAAAQRSSFQAGSAPSIELRVTANVQQNSVTVSGDPGTISQIDMLIEEAWDLPLRQEAVRIYDLEFTDPIKIRDVLQNMLEQGGGGGGGARRPTGGTQVRTQGAGGGADVSQIVGGIYRIEAYPDSNRLIVLSKTSENFPFLDSIIASIDTQIKPNLPVLVPLKYANAEELSDQLNAILAQAGVRVDVARSATGLNNMDEIDSGSNGTTGGSSSTPSNTAQADAGRITFPWQQSREGEDQTPESSLIGRVRIVPIARQNALAVLAAPEYRDAVIGLVSAFDRPGRQVMITAIIAEVELRDELALGLRVSNSDIVPSLSDNTIGGTVGMQNEATDVLSNLFDTSVLNANMSVNVLLQALNQKTNVRVLQEPRVFTADNQEAVFFDGQEVPFITDSQTTDNGSFTQGFDYKKVGIKLNVRPRITQERDVNMEVYLELSSIVPGQTLFGGFIIDRRTTTTQVVIKDGQTIVLSGILTDQESEVRRGVPYLSDIPIIGELFTSREKSNVRTELIAFITPTVVDHPSENDSNFNAQERKYLEELIKPLQEQIKTRNQESNRDRLKERILQGASKTVDQPIPVEPLEPRNPEMPEDFPSSADPLEDPSR